MRFFYLITGLLLWQMSTAQQNTPALSDEFVLVIHGGAGTILKKNMTPEKEKAYNDALEMALKIGYDTLKKGGTALDAVEMAVRYMEDCPLFNAGKGAVFTNEGKNELDAAIMNGKTLAAGSIAGVTTIKNPISTARAVMEKSNHVMLIGKGAEKFAAENHQTIVDPSYFFTEQRWEALQDAKREDSLKQTQKTPDHLALKQPENRDYKYGTVGAVALDRYGNLAAATSTGGMTNKKFGRVGDAPIIGAGTYANNKTCAISCTGWGEYFIRLTMAKTISDMMEFGNWKLTDATNEMVMKRLPALGGDGGLIALDKDGNITLPFCTEGMYRGFVRQDGKTTVKIYKE
ncbi:MAG: isoaspartyl peptidase/L-asparaginase [Sphingobacteriales bacterium]|nr:isoaspartyl peptidase/L-asparaginase [Sphingobacteriales bacterium]MBI3720384.1 isoaspartyl peptidase/L-asparaginase [Sphingobacteriales bacterium]